eukprot:Em0901g1a
MATPNTAPSDDSMTTTLMGGGAWSSGNTSHSPYKLITGSPLPQDLEESVYTVEMVSFPAMTYLGCSAVNAPRSENEASSNMEVMRKQAVDALQVILKVPVTNEGSILLLDPQNQQALLKFPIKYILFCTRGKVESTMDCLFINVRLQNSYHCYVFKAPNPETCQKVFDAIGKSFRIEECEFHVKVEIHEDDGRGGSSRPYGEGLLQVEAECEQDGGTDLSQLQSETSKPLHIE